MDIKALFDQAAQSYDQSRRLYIPFFDDFYGTVLALLPYPPDADVHILDLGAGTGLLTALVAAALPNARFTLLDISDEMLAQARLRFADERARFAYTVADFAQAELTGEYDAVISALAIHHLADGDKQRVYAQAYHLLKPGGRLINADQTLGQNAEIDAHYEAAWLRQVRANGATEAQINIALERMKADRYAPLATQLTWLERIGFVNVNCWYQNYRWAVFSGEKSEELIVN